jgi:cyclic pyranopterin phosphate synthase
MKQHNAKNGFTHVDDLGKARMVDISAKPESLRTAIARGYIILSEEIIRNIKDNLIKKGDVLVTARIAGINAAKKTSELIPLCHNIRLSEVVIDLQVDHAKNRILSVATVKAFDRTGVEMEAMTAVAASLLTIYDMCKALSKEMIIGQIELVKKEGGKSSYNKI